MTKPIITDTFKLSPTVYFKIAAGAILPKLMLISSSTLLITLIISLLVDIRFVLVTLIILFLLIPMIVSHIYFSKLLTREAQYALTTKHVIINLEKEIIETFESANDENTPLSPRHWQWKNIKSRKISGKNLVIRFHDKDYTLIIPLNAINRDIDINRIAEPIE